MELGLPTEEDPLSDQARIRMALDKLGFHAVKIPVHVLQKLYPMCRDCDFRITVTLVYEEQTWFLTAAEPGDTTKTHYGSTMIVMQLVDLQTGQVTAEAKQVNGQVLYGTDILTRITYTLKGEECKHEMQRVR